MAKNSKIRKQSLNIPKSILVTVQILQFISLKLVTLFASRLFMTPLKHKIPKRELEMDQKSRQEKVRIPTISKEVVVYHYGTSKKKILLVHGWSGRGTQLVKIADALLETGYSTISFDAPAHGKSGGKTTLMLEFIATILELEKQFGPFEGAVGHSLGGMSLLNALKQGLKINRLVTIGSGDIVQDIIDDFTYKLRMKHKVSNRIRLYFENRFDTSMDSFSAYLSAKEIEIPVLVIHDNDDDEVPVKCGIHIHKYLKNGKLMITKDLGHRKILGDEQVVESATNFITN
ncbi:pimeloyl-ACP methyl ester carboxylesterase [Flavobacterium arsenatis]|uniref:Pimeloyl-ACP methyl ester carboxylesterase n=1 Tax=Flavobacterium arsenatis TaxID=1484332 RepID=A0ABU1TNB6_9FLAO|nr:alpha/beta hydrolase [Flavobacterium arsenatis]MDR6967457.1 pimeloyl-ACP methyl ester carboxylesterase [Flavobacterium arsenatis]